MGQALRKVTEWRRTSSVLRKSVPESHKPMETRFEDPRFRGHLPGDVYPTRPEPHPIIEPGDDPADWDRSDPKYKVMVQEIAGNIITRSGEKLGPGGEALHRRPLPSNRHTSVGTGPSEDFIVAPGTLNLAHIRQMLSSYQGLAESDERHLDGQALAKKYNVDAALLEKVLQFCEIPEKKEELKSPTPDAGSKLT